MALEINGGLSPAFLIAIKILDNYVKCLLCNVLNKQLNLVFEVK